MQQKNITISYKEFTEEEIIQFDDATQTLIAATTNNLKNAYAPYSKFKVSAGVLMENGQQILGTNQENAAYPSGTCAERVAVFYAHASFPNEIIKQIVIVTEKGNEIPLSPCGSCRQALIEFEKQQQHPIKVILKSGKSPYWQFSSMADLLPLAFDASQL